MSDVEVDLKATNARPYDYYEQDLSDEDNRKSISAAPSFEEYMNQRATDEWMMGHENCAAWRTINFGCISIDGELGATVYY